MPIDLSPQSQSILVNLNGEITKAANAKVSVFDRSYLYGDSLYEVVRSYDGHFLKLDEHLVRLGKSAELTHMTLGQSLQHYEKEILRTYQAWRELPGHEKADAYCRIVVSRGEGKIGFGLGSLTTSSLYTIILQPLELPTPEARKRGYYLKISERMRNDPVGLDPAMKTGNYLNSLLAYLEAGPGFDDAL